MDVERRPPEHRPLEHRPPACQRRALAALSLILLVLVSAGAFDAAAKKGKKSKAAQEDLYAAYVWPAPPDPPRIRLQAVLHGRRDVEADSKLKRVLIGASPQSPFDSLVKPFAVVFDPTGRILVSDPGLAAVLRFDREGSRLDVLGVRGTVRLKTPLGMGMGPSGTVYVADAGIQRVVAYDPKGGLVAAYGASGELSNPTDAALSSDGSKLFVADSKAHKIKVFDTEHASLLTSFGRRGEGEGELNFPTSLVFGPDGNLFVVDQLNARVQIFTPDGGYVDQLGALGVAFGNFVRPKDLAVDEMGLLYVTDNAFNNLQIFGPDLRLLTFVGEGGRGPGQFHGASGVAVRGDLFAVVDQLGRRLQLFRFLVPKDAP